MAPDARVDLVMGRRRVERGAVGPRVDPHLEDAPHPGLAGCRDEHGILGIADREVGVRVDHAAESRFGRGQPPSAAQPPGAASPPSSGAVYVRGGSIPSSSCTYHSGPASAWRRSMKLTSSSDTLPRWAAIAFAIR